MCDGRVRQIGGAFSASRNPRGVDLEKKLYGICDKVDVCSY